MSETEATPEVLARAKELLAQSRGNNSQSNNPPVTEDKNVTSVDIPEEELNKYDPKLKPNTDPTKAPPLEIPGISLEQTTAPPVSDEIKVLRSERPQQDNNKTDIWEDKNSGKVGITINEGMYEIPRPVYDLFLRMVTQMRNLSGDLQTERENLSKLKTNMVQT
jgi:hypothetical protein